MLALSHSSSSPLLHLFGQKAFQDLFMRSLDITSPALIEPLAEKHKADWFVLFEAYAKHCKVFQNNEMRHRTWTWLMDSSYNCECLVAVDQQKKVLGFAHFRAFISPLFATMGGQLDDLFVDTEARGRRIGELLLEAVANEGRRRKWTVIRWMSADTNVRASAVYDRVARLTTLRTYDMALARHTDLFEDTPGQEWLGLFT